MAVSTIADYEFPRPRTGQPPTTVDQLLDSLAVRTEVLEQELEQNSGASQRITRISWTVGRTIRCSTDWTTPCGRFLTVS